jgi:hypothetical protein
LPEIKHTECFIHHKLIPHFPTHQLGILAFESDQINHSWRTRKFPRLTFESERKTCNHSEKLLFLRHQQHTISLLSSCKGDVFVLACFSHCYFIYLRCWSRKLIKRASDKKNEFRICVEPARHQAEQTERECSCCTTLLLYCMLSDLVFFRFHCSSVCVCFCQFHYPRPFIKVNHHAHFWPKLPQRWMRPRIMRNWNIFFAAAAFCKATKSAPRRWSGEAILNVFHFVKYVDDFQIKLSFVV